MEQGVWLQAQSGGEQFSERGAFCTGRAGLWRPSVRDRGGEKVQKSAGFEHPALFPSSLPR